MPGSSGRLGSDRVPGSGGGHDVSSSEGPKVGSDEGPCEGPKVGSSKRLEVSFWWGPGVVWRIALVMPCCIKKAAEEAAANGDSLSTEGQVAQ